MSIVDFWTLILGGLALVIAALASSYVSIRHRVDESSQESLVALYSAGLDEELELLQELSSDQNLTPEERVRLVADLVSIDPEEMLKLYTINESTTLACSRELASYAEGDYHYERDYEDGEPVKIHDSGPGAEALRYMGGDEGGEEPPGDEPGQPRP